MDLDDVLSHVGDWNKYQHLLLWLVCLPACIPIGFTAFNQVFMDRTVDHWCQVPELVASGWSHSERKAVSIPKQDLSTYSQCTMYDLNYTMVVEAGVDYRVANETSIVPCRYGWEYAVDQVESSIVIDFDLVCSRALYPTLGLSALNVGGLFGCLLFGYLNDRLGRKKSYFVCLTVSIVFGVATALAPNMLWWSIFRFFVGTTVPAILHIPFVICLEVVAPSKRTLVSFYSNMFYVVGLLGFSGLAYILPNWKWLALASVLPFLLYYLYVFFMPESLRWLLAQEGRIDEVIEKLKMMAKINNKQVPDEALAAFKDSIERQQQRVDELRRGHRANIQDLFRTPNMRLKTIIISFSWVVNETVYVGLSYYGPSMPGNAYLSFFLSSIVEVPGYVACLLLMDRWGRRIVLCLCMVTSGVASISTALLPADAEITTLALYLLAKCTIAGGTMIIFQFGGELYPTEVRGVGIGLASFLGGVGLTIIPFINYLGTQWLVLPIVIMGSFSIAGGLISLELPETHGVSLPQTIEEGEQFGKDFSGWKHTCHQLRSWCLKRWAPRSRQIDCHSGIHL